MDSITLDNGRGLGDEDVSRSIGSSAQLPPGTASAPCTKSDKIVYSHTDRMVLSHPHSSRVSLAYGTMGVSPGTVTLSQGSVATLTFSQGAASLSQSHSSTALSPGLVTLSQGSISLPQGTVVLSQGQERMIITQGDNISISPSFTQDIQMSSREQLNMSPGIGRGQMMSPGLSRDSIMSPPMARDQMMSSTMARDQMMSPQSQRDQMF